MNNIEYDTFSKIFMKIFNFHAPIKKKFLRANQGAFMTKELHKAIMKRSRFHNIFLREKTEISHNTYKRQRNLCVNLLRKAKKQHYSNLDIKKLTEQ